MAITPIKFFVGLFAALLCAPLPLAAKTTVIYHTSDTHGFFYPPEGVGGFAALASLLDKEARPFLLLDGGDFSNGGIEATASKGLKSVEVMNALPYAAGTVGNHEFYFGDAAFETMIRRLSHPLIAANLAARDTGLPPAGITPYEIFGVDGVRIAVVGLATTKIQSSHYLFIPSVLALERALYALENDRPLPLHHNDGLEQALHRSLRKAARADVVILLTHSSIKDRGSAEESFLRWVPKHFPGKFHIVLGGHAHNVIQNETIGETLFVESGYGLKGVSRIEIETDDETGAFASARSEYIVLDEKITGSRSDVAALLDELRDHEADQVLAEASASVGFRPDTVTHRDTPLRNWVADACKAYSGAEVFIFNNGAVRKEMQKGPVTRRDVLEFYPYENYVVQVKVSGLFLKELVRSGLTPGNTYSYAGLNVKYSLKNGVVSNLEIWVNGKTLQEDRIYRAAVNDYIAFTNAAKTGFRALSDSSEMRKGTAPVQQILEEALMKQNKIIPPKTGRIIQTREEKE